MFIKSVDRVIVSSDDSPRFLNFWPCVSRAWLKFFDIRPTLALVTNRSEGDSLVSRLKQFGEVYIIKPVPGIPIPNQAKLARFVLAAIMNNQVCMVEDIDTIPLQSTFIEDLVKYRKPHKILAVGHEVYDVETSGRHRGKFPISNMTAEGYIFQRLFNPRSLGDSELISSFLGACVFDSKEDVANHPAYFSDESLIRALIYQNKLEYLVQKVSRNVNPLTDWIDRSWWHVDVSKLNSGGYVACNFIRPCKPNAFKFVEIYKYIYGFLPSAEEVFVL